MRIKLVVTDIDGTLTETRSGLRLSVEALRAVRRLENAGIMVSLATGNGHVIAAGLARYIGATGPVIAENGCVIFYRERLIPLCSERPPPELVKQVLGLGLRESWQNPYKLYDLGFLAEDKRLLFKLKPRVEDIVRRMGWPGKVLVSGYALHIQPAGAGKGRALVEAAKLVGVPSSSVAAVGDSPTDIDMLMASGLPAAVGDADPELKRVAKILASKPAGSGFAEIAETILREQEI